MEDESAMQTAVSTNMAIEERPSKKPKLEYALPEGFLDPIIRPSTLVLDNTSSSSPSMSKQFWKAGDYEPPLNNNQSISHLAAGMDHLRVHPRFLHSNATSHKWALGAFAELLDNSFDEVRTGATYVNVDVLDNEIDPRNKMLLVEDNGGGMTPDKMRRCMSLGYSVKSKVANTIGQYGNGFKTSTMRLGADVLVFTRCPGEEDGSRPTQSIGMLSYTFLMETGKEDIVVPMIDFEKRGEEWEMITKSSHADWERNKETIVHWSPYSTEERLLQQFDFLKDQGTRIIIYNLWEDEEGQLELDFDTNKDDIQIRGVNRDPKKIEMAKDYPNSRFFLTYRHSLRSYAAILYLSLPNGFRIILRGKDVNHHKITDDMMLAQKVIYKPTADGTTRNDQNQMSTEVTLGFVKDAKDHIDVQGFNVYHKNRLIKPFWRVWNAAGSDGRGVIGVLEADFVEPAHDKQEFERTPVLSRLENRLIAIQKKYWSTNCQEIGYAKRCKGASVTKCKPSIIDKFEEGRVSTGTDSNDASKVKLRPPVESAQNDEEAYTCTVRKSQCKSSTSLKESRASISILPSKLYQATNGAELREANLELRRRLGSSESVMINNLLLDLRSERDKNVLLENQLLKAQETIEKLDQDQVKLIDIFSEERQRREEMEETLRNKLKEAKNTVEELRKQIEAAKKQSD
ncbi:protein MICRORCHIDIA 7 isoform X1 [Helianthus annuus]|uniref:protein MICRORCHIDIA 7 isoform X1 n=1 Tax=Helianthus annuus TaxID=4232 RepID=UPI000B9021A8|nr:protein MICRORCHIDIA 7 isoform X1 [Helianthus annuus]